MRYEVFPQDKGWHIWDNVQCTMIAECKWKDDAENIVNALHLVQCVRITVKENK